MKPIVNPALRDPDSCPRLRLVGGYYLQNLVVLSTQDVVVRIGPIVLGPMNPNS